MEENKKVKQGSQNMREFTVNEYLTLKLEKDETIIYVAGEKFEQCKFLLLEIRVTETEFLDKLESIDEAVERLDASLEPRGGRKNIIPPDVEFWGHCSNLQVWYEQDYNTRLLHRNLAFPLLKALADAGDPKSKRNFKEEIGKRFSSNFGSVIEYLLEENYLFYLEQEELEVLSSLLSNETKARVVNFIQRRLEKIQGDANQRNQIYDHLSILCNEEDLKQIEYVEYEGTKYFVINKRLAIPNVKKIGDIKGLSSLVNLEGLYLTGKSYFKEHQINKIEGLEHLKNLKVLDLSVNKISEINGLDNLGKLEILKLESNNISEIKGLENLKKLKKLHLSNNLIIELKGLENLKHLEKLYLYSNKITEIKGLEELSNLNMLSLSYNNISEIKGLENLCQLKALYLEENKIFEIKGLENLKKLRLLHLNSNFIIEIKGLENLEELRILDLEDNKIDMIKGLSYLKNLESLNLGNNNIREIKGLEGLYRLEWLDLSDNKLPNQYDNCEYQEDELSKYM